eukprot:g17822.t1
MPTCVKGTCGGHKGGDMLPFKLKLTGEIVKMTNLELYNFIFPDNDDLSYMYNEFDWDHRAWRGRRLRGNRSRIAHLLRKQAVKFLGREFGSAFARALLMMRAAAVAAIVASVLVVGCECTGGQIAMGLSENTRASANIAADAAGKEYGETRGAAQREGSGALEYATAHALGFTTTNEYPPIEHSRWLLLAEPFRSTTFTAISNVGDPEKDVFKWTFPDTTVLEGRVVSHTFTEVGPHEVVLTQIVVSTGNVYRMHASVMVKYVRREIRQLTDEDREAFFDAMETLYRLPTAEGTALYGKEYKGINFFVQMHLDGAGVKDCDHWHDGAGIMTHHMGYILQFEQALQVVDPSVSIPYWEYTIESALGMTDYGESEVFGPDWFGNASPDNPLHTVDDGRWAYLPLMKDAWEHVHNPYGLLRSPWNLDGTPFVTRHNMTNGQDLTSVVSCAVYQNAFESISIASLNRYLNGFTHGPVHVKVGGVWNNPEQELTIKLGYSDTGLVMSKSLWRKGYLRMPSTCSQEENGLGDTTTCRSSCPAELYQSSGMTPYDVLMDALAIHWIASYAGGIIVYKEEEDRFVVAGHEGDEDFQQEFWKRVLHSLCDPGHVGDLYSSSSPYDPLFWVIHPSTERVLGWRRKLATEQPDMWPLDEAWGYKSGLYVGETGVVCDWTGVREDSLDMPTCIKSICGGHRGGDTLPFEVKVKGETIKMTNLQWYDFIYPDNEDLPYMYNEFQWDHCAAEGYYMGTREG